MSRHDERADDELRPHIFHTDYLHHAKGSVLVECGNTRVLCAVSVVKEVPRWMRDQGVPGGWLTSEYQMLPASTNRRSMRDSTKGRPNGRTQEIQRLIGRSLRAVVDLKLLGPHTFYVDCDVIDADGGTRCASINGAMVALRLAVNRMFADGELNAMPIRENLAAISVGMVDGRPLLDLCYVEDAAAEVDMNVVMTESGKFVELQGTAEEAPFSEDEMLGMLSFAKKGISEIVALQRAAIQQ